MKREDTAHRPRSFVLFLALVLSILSRPTAAAITTSGDIDPACDSSDPWNIEGRLVVGHHSEAGKVISNGSRVTNSEGRIGFPGGDHSSNVTVTGLNSEWLNSSDLYVGYWGAADMTISDGGRVTSTNGYAGFKITGQGNIAVTGSGSVWENSANLYVGYDGYADVVISDGGKITNVDGYTGHTTGFGEVAVTGPASHWENSGDLYVGYNGDAQLTISNGGKVTGARNYVGYDIYPVFTGEYK